MQSLDRLYLEMKVIFRGNLEHPQVNERIFVPGKSDMMDLTRFAGFQHCFLSSTPAKDSVGILRANHFVMLQ